ncbi:hypothetical protein [Methylocystis parvus]|uniref:hypothetical protein n=1 Tax=Methylocystis parvus TaxID=134 RepID=UPI003C75A9B5
MAQIQSLQAKYDGYLNMIKGAEAIGVIAAESTESSPLQSSAPHIEPPKPAPIKAAGSRPRDKSWTSTINAIVSRESSGITYEGLREELKKTHLAGKLSQTDKSFYGGIGKLVDRKLLVKHKGHLFTPEALNAFLAKVRSGEVADLEPPAGSHHSPFGDAIKSFLDGRANGASSSEIAAELRSTPELADTMERHKTHLYNVLSRLVDQGELVKGGGRFYRSPAKIGRDA